MDLIPSAVLLSDKVTYDKTTECEGVIKHEHVLGSAVKIMFKSCLLILFSG